MREPPQIFATLFSLIPLGIGVTVLGFLWLTPFNEFGSPPLFFRIFGSFIAFGFVLFGLGGIYTALNSEELLKSIQENQRAGDPPQSPSDATPGQKKSGYICLHCGAPLARAADVSPHGDVKCEHCGKWFNVHSA